MSEKRSYAPDPKPVKRQKNPKGVQDVCPHGHPMTDAENVYINQRGIRECRCCRRARNAAHKERLRAAGLKPNRGRRKPNPPRLVTCPTCGTERTIYYDSISKKCQSCAHKNAQLRQFTCPCGKQFSRKDSYRAKYPRFCSMRCRRTYGGFADQGKEMSQKRKGKSNPNFRHGDDVGRKHWNVAAKGESSCRNCGEGGFLHLHHVIPRSKFRAGRDVLLNGIPLCPTCHMRWHKSEMPIYRDVFTPDEWRWLSSVELTGELIEDWLDRRYPRRLAKNG